MKLKEMLTSFQKRLRCKFLTKTEISFLLGSLIILSIFLYFNFDEIENSNLASSATEISYAGLVAFVLAKYFFKKEEISISKKEIKEKLSNLSIIGLEINAIFNILEESSKQDLSFLNFTLSKTDFIGKKENVLQNLKDVEDKIDMILEISKINFIEVSSILSLLKEAKDYLKAALNQFGYEDYPYMSLEILNLLHPLNSFENIVNNLANTYTELLKKL